MLYVALGDSFTEGVGDSNVLFPNGVRGWADRFAEGLAAHEPGWEYANLAVRSKRLRHVISEQLDVALALKPDLVTLYAGGNDVMDFGTRVPDLLSQLDLIVDALTQGGAKVLLFTGYDVEVSVVLTPLRRKNHAYNQGIRAIAAKYGCMLVDYERFNAFANPRLWSKDRLHMSKQGHKYMAAALLTLMGVPHEISAKQKPRPTASLSQRVRGHYRWLREWVLPMFGRKLRGVTMGDITQPRWPEPVRVPPRKGLKKLVDRAGR